MNLNDYKKYSKKEEIVEANQKMEGKHITDRLKIAKEVVSRFVDLEQMEESEQKNVLELLFDNFPANSVVVGESLDVLDETDPDLIPLVLEVVEGNYQEVDKVVMVPYYLGMTFIQREIKKIKEFLEKECDAWFVEDVIERLPFYVNDEHYWLHVKI